MKQIEKNFKIDLPRIIYVEDYHDFDFLKQSLVVFLGESFENIKVAEIGYMESGDNQGYYKGVIYSKEQDSEVLEYIREEKDGDFIK